MSMFRYIQIRKHKERVSLTPEGFAYLTVLCFITVGSIMRNVNLLILMAGLMFAPLFINWRLAVYRIRSLRGLRRPPNRIHANQLVKFQWECENTLRAFPAMNVMVHDQIRRAPDAEQTLDRDLSPKFIGNQNVFRRWFGELIDRIWRRSDRDTAKVQVRFQRLLADQPETQTFRSYFAQRGKYYLGPAEIVSSFPFGLIVSRQRIGQRAISFVAPELGNLETSWEKRIQSSAAGADSAHQKQSIEGDDFFGLRPWRTGDNKKNIHWRSTAKQGFPIVKQHERRNNRDFAIVLDLYIDNDAPETSDYGDAINRCEMILSFAATALLNIGTDVEGQVAMSICGHELSTHRSRTVSGLIADVMPALAVARGSVLPNIVDGIVASFDCVSHGTPIYVISSREQPSALSSGLMVESLTKTDDEDRSRYFARRVRQSLPALRWLDVDDDDFTSLFSMNRSTGGDRIMPPALKQVSQKWIDHAKS
jgi:hypothetical protein